MSDTPPRIFRLNEGNPILQRIEQHPWENKVTFNPACALVTERHELNTILPQLPFTADIRAKLSTFPALCFLLYRAQGKKTERYDHTRSAIGLAVLDPDLTLLARHREAVILPERDFENLGVEDARITKVGSRYIMFYTAYGESERANKIRIAVASSTNFVGWEKHGLLRGALNEIDNKNAMLFPDKLHGEYIMLHRPMDGKDAMAIHWATASELFGEWKTHGVLMKPISNPKFVDTWIGGGAPPLKLSDGRYLLIYHVGNRKADRSREYDLGLAIADFSRKEIIVRRIEPLLRPETKAETSGDVELGVNNVVFICGAYFWKRDLCFPYAGADSVVLGGRIEREEIDRYVSSS